MGSNVIEAYYRGKQLREQSDAAAQARKDRDELRQVGADVEPVIKEAAGGMGPSAVMVGKQAYGTEGDAQVAADKFNAPEAKIARQQGALIAQGRPDASLELGEKAMKYSAMSKKLSDAMKAEGIGDFIDGNMMSAPRVEDIEAGKAGVFDFNPEEVKKFNAVGGKVTIGAGQKGRWTTFALNNGRKVADFEVIDADGKPVAPSARSIQLIAQMTAQSREELGDKQFEQGKRISVAQQGVDIERRYRDGMLDATRDRAQTHEKATGNGAGRDRMSEVDKEEFSMHRDAAQKINEAIMRAQVEGTWEPQKNESQFALMLQREKALRKAQEILGRYRQEEGGASTALADPYGVRARLDAMKPPKFDVSGSPAEFRKQLVGKVTPDVLAAFDKEHPGAGGRPSKPVASQGVQEPPAAAQSAPPAAARQKIPAIAEKGVLEMLLPTPQGGSKAQSLRDQKNQDRDRMIQQAAAQQGFAPTESFGNGGMLRKPERMYINPKTGERRWESQLVDLE